MKRRIGLIVMFIVFLWNRPFAQKDANAFSYKALVIKDPLSGGLHLDTFYRKYVDACGIPIVSSSRVCDEALLVARDIVNYMLSSRSDIRRQLCATNARVMVMGRYEMETDLPEHSKWKKPWYNDPRLTPVERENYDKPGGISSMSDREYWNRRARGMGGNETSCAEENLIGIPGTRYYGENILVHEFSHNIMNAFIKCDPDLYHRLEAAYREAVVKGKYKGQYAINTIHEYWAEGTQWWFWSNFGFYDGLQKIVTPDDLKRYDPVLYALLAEVYTGHHIPVDIYYGRSEIR